MLTGSRPFESYDRPGDVVLALERGELPSPRRPLKVGNHEIIWEMLERCWSRQPQDRPHISQILEISDPRDVEPISSRDMPPAESSTISQEQLIPEVYKNHHRVASLKGKGKAAGNDSRLVDGSADAMDVDLYSVSSHTFSLLVDTYSSI